MPVTVESTVEKNGGPVVGEVDDVTDVTGNIFAIFEPPPGEWRVRLARLDDFNRKPVPHGILTLEEARLDQIQSLFGGGKYRAQLIDQNSKIAGTREFQLAGVYKPPTGPLPGIGGATLSQLVGPAPAVAVPGGVVQTAMSPREAVDTALVSSVLEMMKGLRQQATPDWTPLLTVLVTTAGTVITALLQRKSGPDPAVMGQLEMLKAELQELRNKPGPASSAITDVLASIERIVKVSGSLKHLTEGEPGESGDMFNQLGKLAIGVLSNAQQNQQQPQQQQLPATTGAPAIPLPMWHRMLLDQKRRLLDAATRGLDPDMVAEYAVNFAPENTLGILREFTARPDADTVLTQVIPELGEFPQWTLKLIESLRAALSEDGPDDGVTG